MRTEPAMRLSVEGSAAYPATAAWASSASASAIACFFGRPSTRVGASITFLESRLVREEAEALEHHPDLRPLAGDRAFRVLDELPVAFPIADGVAVHLDPARVDPRTRAPRRAPKRQASARSEPESGSRRGEDEVPDRDGKEVSDGLNVVE